MLRKAVVYLHEVDLQIRLDYFEGIEQGLRVF
jgi:hypothetical protein